MTENDHTHCYHDLGLMLTSFPPQRQEVCCHCGHAVTYPMPTSGSATAPTVPPHGPHLPRFTAR